MTLHYLNDVAYDAESIKNENYVIIACLKCETMGNLINSIPGLRFLYQVYQAPLRERMLKCSTSLAMPTSVLEALPGQHDIKRHSPSFLYISASLAMSSSVLEALTDTLDINTHLVLSIYF